MKLFAIKVDETEVRAIARALNAADQGQPISAADMVLRDRALSRLVMCYAVEHRMTCREVAEVTQREYGAFHRTKRMPKAKRTAGLGGRAA